MVWGRSRRVPIDRQHQSIHATDFGNLPKFVPVDELTHLLLGLPPCPPLMMLRRPPPFRPNQTTIKVEIPGFDICAPKTERDCCE